MQRASQPAVQPNFPEAATLYERLGQLHRPEAWDHERIERRLTLWRREFGVEEGGLEELLHLEQLETPVLSALLSVPPSDMKSQDHVWANQLFGNETSSDVAGTNVQQPFLRLITPVLQAIRTGLRQRLADLEWPGDLNTAIDDLLLPLHSRLTEWLSRMLVLELNVARVEGRLKGETGEARYQDFIDSLQQSDIRRSIFQEYQVLGRMITEALERWSGSSEVLLRRLAADWPMLKQTFGDELRQIVRLQPGKGDTHRRGQSVCSVDCGGRQLMYKPRSLKVDVQFQELLGFLNARLELPFRTLQVLDRGTYGYVEFVNAAPCTDLAAARRFYQRQGSLLALLYTLRGTDFHFENVIASGEYPVPVDLEALFHPVPTAVSESQEHLHSVLLVGLLPQRVKASQDNPDGIEVGGLNGGGGEGVLIRQPYFKSIGTDEMQLDRHNTWMPSQQNRPQLDTDLLDAGEFIEDVVGGFQTMYRVLTEARSELLSSGGPLAAFADAEVRYIARPTQMYTTLLFESFHPDYLRSGLDRDRLLSRLWLSARHQPRLIPLLPFERADLNAGDIPLFSAKPGSRDLWASDGTRLAEYLAEPSLEAARRQLGRLDDRDLERQVSLIRSSFASLTLGEGHGTPSVMQEIKGGGTGAPSDFLEEASRIGERLATLAFEDGEQINWYGLRLMDGRRWQLMPLDYDLYGGLSGIALFLGQLGHTVGNTAWSGLARRAIREGVRQARQSQGGGVGFAGLGGLIYAAAHLGALWGDEALLADADSFTASFQASAGRDEVLDVIGGSAGGVLSALALHQVRPGGGALEAALACGERLLARARSGPAGLFWQGPGQSHPLMGFSHGGSGIALALARLGQVTERRDFLQAARSAVDFERSHYDKAHQNWPDFRDDVPQSDSQSFMWAWCHGAPGIAIGRAAMLDAVDDSGVRQDLTAALASTQAHGLGGNHSLCHGSLGNIGALLTAAGALQDPRLTEAARQAGSHLVRQVQGQSWRCGVPDGAETPGLMTGLAGIGYGLLRLARPSEVPDVLSLAAPVHLG